VKLKTLLSFLELNEDTESEQTTKLTTINACENIKISLREEKHVDEMILEKPKQDEDMNDFAT
jgi:hypothetical protein